MDSRIRNLWRNYWKTHDGAMAGSLYQAMQAAGNTSLSDFVALRDSLEENNTELLRTISQYLYGRGVPYPTPQNWATRKFDYQNPPEGASNWALVEFNQTRFWSQDIQDQVIAITGVYLTNTQHAVHIASLTPSVELYPLYANIIHVIDTSDFELLSPEYDERIHLDETIENEWGASEEVVSYCNRSQLKNAINWYWIPNPLILWLEGEDYEETRNELLDYYTGNHAL